MPTAPATAYDRVPYKSHPFRQSHPDRLAVIATLHGMSPVPIERARVLELGCASGGNLVPMADQFPEATFLGLDMSIRQIQDGQKIVERSGLKNVELRHQDILEFDAPAESFDYILCHGVFSWVPDAVQRKILDICGKCLSPNGVGYVSYNTYPGWHMRGMIRDIMRYRAQFFDKPEQQLKQARGLLTFLSESVKTENNAYGILLKNELEAISGADDSYLIHEHLEEVNDPLYFHEFAERADASGLQYLGEADYGSMSLDNFPEPIQAMLQSVSRDIVEMEQYMDFVRNRMFRQTLLCRKEVALDRVPKPQQLLRLEVASSSKPETEVNLQADERTTFRRGSSVLTTSDPVVKAAMQQLREVWPMSIPFLELAAIARSRIGGRMSVMQTDAMSPATLHLAGTMLRCYGTSQIDLRTTRPGFTLQISERPLASPLARTQAEAGLPVTDRQHGSPPLDDFQRQLLVLLDGTRSRTDLLEALTQKVRNGELLLHQNGNRVSASTNARELLDSWLTPAMESLARCALLVEQ